MRARFHQRSYRLVTALQWGNGVVLQWRSTPTNSYPNGLLSNPKLLVMDEAISALDYETERRVCDNLLENLMNAWVFYHPPTLNDRRADRVVMMHQGQ